MITPRPYPIAGETHKWDSLFGIELELENVVAGGDAPWDNCPDGWTIHEDASLRNGLEYVTSRPIGAERLEEVIESFYDKGLTYTTGPRTSTHIHVNMSDATVEELRTMIALVYTIEDAIYICTEESRKWGGYSVALSEMRPQRLRNILNAPNNQMFVNNVMPGRNNERYYGFNCNISRHGTAEFRYFPGGPTQDELVSWVDLVALIKKASKKFTIQYLSGLIASPHDLGVFLTANFGEWAAKLIAARSLSDMYNAFETVMAMAMDEENLERSGGVVHLTPALLNYVEKNILESNPEAIEYLKGSIPRSLIVSDSDWSYMIERSRQLMGNKRKTFIQAEDPYAHDAFTDNDQPYHEDNDEEDYDDYDEAEREREEAFDAERQTRIDEQILQMQASLTAPSPVVRAALPSDYWDLNAPPPATTRPVANALSGRLFTGSNSLHNTVLSFADIAADETSRSATEQEAARQIELRRREREERARSVPTYALYGDNPFFISPAEGDE